MTVRGLPPRTTETAQPYWDGLRRHEITLQYCKSCERSVFYPRVLCPHCGGTSLEWRRVDEVATLYTFTVAEEPVSAAFIHLKRPVLAIAEIAGVRIPTTLTNADPDNVKIGMALTPVFDSETYPDVTLLRFRLADTREPQER